MDEITAERDMLKAIVLKTVKRNRLIATGVPNIKFYVSGGGDISYGFVYRMPGTGESVSRMGYSSIHKAKAALSVAINNIKPA